MPRPLAAASLVVLGATFLLSTCVRVHVHVEMPEWLRGSDRTGTAAAPAGASPVATAPAPVPASARSEPDRAAQQAEDAARAEARAEEVRAAALREARREAEQREAARRQEQLDALIETTLRIAGEVQRWALKPRIFGGGDGHLGGVTFAWLGHNADEEGVLHTVDGRFRLEADSAAVRVVGRADGLNQRVVAVVTGSGASGLDVGVEVH